MMGHHEDWCPEWGYQPCTCGADDREEPPIRVVRPLTRWQRFMVWLTPHDKPRWRACPCVYRRHKEGGCSKEHGCTATCRKARRKLGYSVPRALLVRR